MKWWTYGHDYKLYQCVGCCRDHTLSRNSELRTADAVSWKKHVMMYGTGCWCVYVCVTKHDTEHVKWKATSACHYLVISIVFVMCQTWVYCFFVTMQFWMLNPWPCSGMQNTCHYWQIWITIINTSIRLLVLVLHRLVTTEVMFAIVANTPDEVKHWKVWTMIDND